MKTKEITKEIIEIIAEPDKWLHLKGSEIYVHKCPVLVNEIENWIEVDDAQLYTKAEYDALVEQLINERYTTGQEIQFSREREEAGPKYQEYLQYIEDCKVKAKEILQNR